jgi:hypothetical protein
MTPKKVNLPIEVPRSKYCSTGGSVVCEHLDTHGYGTGCGLGLGGLEEESKTGWTLKSARCIALIEID